MSNYKRMTIRQRKWMIYLLAILFLGICFTPYTQVFSGLLLGAVANFYNFLLLQKKIADFTEAIVKKQRRGIGTISRFATAALAIMIAIYFEDHFHLLAVVIGLMAPYVIVMLDFFIHRKSINVRKEVKQGCSMKRP